MAFSSVDAYIDAQAPVAQSMLATLRHIVKTTVPEAEETIAYDMPTYRRDGKRFLHFAAWANHVALYAINARVREAFAGELADCSIDGSTLRFSYGEPLPEDLICRIVRYRANLRF